MKTASPQLEEQEDREENRESKGIGCLFIIFAIIAAVASVFVPCLPIWAFNYFADKPIIELNLLNYICSALICGSVMALILFLNIKFNKKEDENSEQSN